MAKIYTKTGDKGMTGLIGGTRVLKSDFRVECYGTIDELNAHIGLLRDQLQQIPVQTPLLDIQERLFVIGAALACDPVKAPKFALPDLKDADVQLLEDTIDQLTASLPKMTHFILPGGHPTISQAHITRCVCRRAERVCVGLLNADLPGGKHNNVRLEQSTSEKLQQTYQLIIQYLNRLSDYLFVLGRHIGQQLSVPEIKWHPRQSD